MRTKTHTLIVFAVAALSAPLFSIPVHGTVPRAAAVVPLPPPAWTVYVLVGGVPVDVTAPGATRDLVTRAAADIAAAQREMRAVQTQQ